MRQRIIATFLILIAATFAYGTQTDWVNFTSPEGRFSLLLPKQPTLEIVTDPTDKKLTHNRFSDFEEGYAFVIEYFDNMIITDPEKYLDDAGEGIVSAIHGSLIRENKISLDGQPGRELELSLTTTNGTNVLGRTRIYAIGNTFYSMSYVWREDIDQTLAAKIGEKFFSSIKIKARG